jgi:hypothetical protein
MRLTQAFTRADKVKRRQFCEEMQFKMGEGGFVERVISDEATFHISGKVNRHSICIWGTVQSHAQTALAWLSKSQRFLCDVPRESARPIFPHWNNCDWRLISGHVGKLVVALTEYQLWRLHPTSGRISRFPPPIFTRMYDCFSTVFFHSAGSDLMQTETTPFSLATPFAGSYFMRFLPLGVR